MVQSSDRVRPSWKWAIKTKTRKMDNALGVEQENIEAKYRKYFKKINYVKCC
jgi:hypothetical protein